MTVSAKSTVSSRRKSESQAAKPQITLNDCPSKNGRNKMDHWNQIYISKLKNRHLSTQINDEHQRKVNIGLAAFKARIRKNVSKQEYIKQMKILDIHRDSDVSSTDSSESNFNVQIHKEFNKIGKKTNTYQQQRNKVK